MAQVESPATLNPVGGGDPIPLARAVLTVGRRPSCNICLKFSDISGLHCEFTFQNGFWLVRDLGSSNGVKVNNEPIRPRKALRPGDEVSIAAHRYVIHYELHAGSGIDEAFAEEDLFEQGLMEKAGLEKPKPTERGD